MPGDFPTRLDLFQLARQFILSRATSIDPQQVDIEGSEVNLFAGIASVVGYQVVLSLIQNINNLLLDGAFGEDLDRYGQDRYRDPRKGASPALGDVRMYRTSTAAGGGSVPSNTRLLTLNNVDYVTTAPATFNALDLAVSKVPVRAVQAGKNSQVGANQIRQFGDPSLLFDPSLQVNNDLATAGGEDVEDDDTYRERLRDFWASARRGTLSAIELGARAVPGVVSAQAQEALTPDPRPARVVQLYIADSSGVSSVALGAAVLAALDEYRAAGIAVIPVLGVPQIIAVSLSLSFKAGVDTTRLVEIIRAAIVEYVNSLGVGQPLYKAQLYSLLQRYASDGLLVSQESIVEPAGDLYPDTGKTLRIRIQDVELV